MRPAAIDGEWELIIPAIDAEANTVTFTVTQLSPFTLVTTPTPSIPLLPGLWFMAAAAVLGAIGWRWASRSV